jgi:hypothetical protein
MSTKRPDRWLVAETHGRSRFVHALLGSLLGLGIWGAASWPCQAAEPEDATPSWQYKLTPSRYVTTGETSGSDLNLRANTAEHTWWIGHYQRGSEFQQTRAGYERTRPWAWGQWTVSLQAATHGFAGGALSSQVGSERVFGLIGYGRTNAQTYYNLNFDPNDAWTWGLGAQAGPSTLTLFRVQDNRLNTEQRNTHALWRWPLGERQRLTLDYAFKSGRPDVGLPAVQGHSFSWTYDQHPWFIHWVKDQHVNYSNADQTRLSVGIRF